MIKLKDVLVKYENNIVLDIKNLELQTRGITALMGNNGSGKSTLIRVVSFLQKPNSGYVEIWKESKPSLKTLRQISVLFPEPMLLKRGVRQNFEFALKSRNLEREFNQRVGEALELVGLDDSFLDKKNYELSSGQTQRIAFALVLALRSRLNLLDEPTNSVDLATSKLFGKAVKYQHEQYKSGFIIASHDEKWLSAIAQDSVFLHRGKVSEFEIKNIFENQNGFLNFGSEVKFTLPQAIKNASKIAINPNKIILSKEPFDGGFIGLLHSVSIIYGTYLLAKVKIGDFLIKAVVSSDKFIDNKLVTGENVYFGFSDEAFLSIE
ncbi:tungstate ABC transporter ATP-binding protein TupC [Campylobacter sp. RM16192]|uniref:tungstate ABC transporter ATP-binding protein TupC n=1 Tax=Campylobacter sp. RM16192 TaxID=1660080 RepID=UPI0014518227|nr:tungstate ABC transporter ATP-binding protein TupC [Campylobacter sp. RM16192]QCD52191.1 tungsten ABC transporter TupABC, ATP-binding protein [Campylobacter sp. RM16192]